MFYINDVGVLQACLRDGEQGLFLATAHPAKFGEVLERDLGIQVPLPEALLAVQDRPLVSEPLAADMADLKARLLAWEPEG